MADYELHWGIRDGRYILVQLQQGRKALVQTWMESNKTPDQAVKRLIDDGVLSADDKVTHQGNVPVKR